MGKRGSRERDLSQSLSDNDFTPCQAADGDFWEPGNTLCPVVTSTAPKLH